MLLRTLIIRRDLHMETNRKVLIMMEIFRLQSRRRGRSRNTKEWQSDIYISIIHFHDRYFQLYTDIFDDINIAEKKRTQTSRMYKILHLTTVFTQSKQLDSEMEKNTLGIGIYIAVLWFHSITTSFSKITVSSFLPYCKAMHRYFLIIICQQENNNCTVRFQSMSSKVNVSCSLTVPRIY